LYGLVISIGTIFGSSLDIDIKTDNFLQTYLYGFNIFFPLREKLIRLNKTRPDWFNNDLKVEKILRFKKKICLNIKSVCIRRM
jgi:hypothetical protein